MAGGNAERGEVVVQVVRGGETKEYTLKLSMNAAVQLQQRRKRPLGQIVQDFSTMDAESIRDVLFLLLQKYHRDEIKTLDQAGDLLDDMGGVHAFFGAFAEVMKQGAAEGADKNPLTAAANSTGDSSTSTVAA